MGRNIESKKIKVGDLDIHYLTGGQGDPLLVVHGGGDGARAWLMNLEALSENYTVYVPDLPGYGHSQPINGDYYIPELAEFVDEFSRSVGLERFHLMGHSLGGGIVLHYALKFPHKVKKLVLVSSMCLGREIALWVRIVSIPAICRAIGKGTLGVLRGVKWVVGKLFATVEFVIPISVASIHLGSSLTTLKAQATVLLNRLSEIMVPTLVVWGAKDAILPVEQAYAAAELIPDCQVKVFEGCGHSVYRDKIAEFSQTLTKFLG
jgi:pimeloyl-ACP methyl ester carboxylesterase